MNQTLETIAKHLISLFVVVNITNKAVRFIYKHWNRKY